MFKAVQRGGQDVALGPTLLLHLQKYKAWAADNVTEEEVAQAKGPAPRAAWGTSQQLPAMLVPSRRCGGRSCDGACRGALLQSAWGKH